jgi:hypothetical protein
MQTDPTARHSPIGSFQRVDYLVHLARDPVATARAVRSPALHPDRHCARHRAPRGVGQGARRPAWSATTLQSHLGWQPSRFLADRSEAERAFQLAERLGSVNAAAAELGTTWPSLRKPSPATAWACSPQPRGGPPADDRRRPPAQRPAGHPRPRPGVRGPQPRRPPGSGTAGAELHAWVRRDEEYAILGAAVVVELYSESRARQPTTRAWAIIRRADRSHRLTSQRASRPDRRHADQPTGPTNPGARDDGRYPLTPTARPDRGGDPGECGAWAG